MKNLKKIFELLYYISTGAWVTSLFITIYYDNSIPMWILLVVMNGFRIISISIKE